ncbi:uncharacterized protein CMC5_058480 [Chondromyces crocatus]|uniref:Uncharacterized protein n=1 Tax=Chondromyces crocatus TaxID=52 RepID=A0A0K1ELV8_CHOCO|nr:uncharacterized protein CMC5_058480 [Chondromyces crocatus]
MNPGIIQSRNVPKMTYSGREELSDYGVQGRVQASIGEPVAPTPQYFFGQVYQHGAPEDLVVDRAIFHVI